MYALFRSSATETGRNCAWLVEGKTEGKGGVRLIVERGKLRRMICGIRTISSRTPYGEGSFSCFTRQGYANPQHVMEDFE